MTCVHSFPDPTFSVLEGGAEEREEVIGGWGKGIVSSFILCIIRAIK
jgi:hypothetical protein